MERERERERERKKCKPARNAVVSFTEHMHEQVPQKPRCRKGKVKVVLDDWAPHRLSKAAFGDLYDTMRLISIYIVWFRPQ